MIYDLYYRYIYIYLRQKLKITYSPYDIVKTLDRYIII